MILSKDKIQLANKKFFQQFGEQIKGMEPPDDEEEKENFDEENTFLSKIRNCLLKIAKKIQRVLSPRSRRYDDPQSVEIIREKDF